MSKYLLSAGVVWVFLCFVIGVIILMMPESEPEFQAAGNGKPFVDQVAPGLPKGVDILTSNAAKTSVLVEGTPAAPVNAAATNVEVQKK